MWYANLKLDICISILEAALRRAAAWKGPGAVIPVKLVKNGERENNEKKRPFTSDR